MRASTVLAPLALLAATLVSASPAPRNVQARWAFPAEVNVLTTTVKDLQEFLTNGTITSVQLTQHYLDLIGNNNNAGLNLRAVIETAPYDNVMAIAQAFDDERANGTIRSGLHGIPMLFKDNINTEVELGMNTTAGGFALLGSVVPSDAPVSAKLRKAGVIVIGKANLSQYANFMGNNRTNGYSARGGQTQSAYVVGGFAEGGDPCGSSSGSGVGVSAGFAAAALGSETDGSIICPSNRAALYGIKMSVGLSSRSGVIPISSTQDTTGPMAKSAYDAALILENMVGYDVNDTATYTAVNHTQTNYTQFTMAPYATFQGMKIGVPREGFFNETLSGNAPEINIAVDAAIAKIQSLGATIQDPANLPTFNDYLNSGNETIVLQNDFKVDFAAYASQLISSPVRTLEDVINFNDAHADLEFKPGECCQETIVASFGTPGVNSPEYLAARASDLMIGTGIDTVLDQYGLDALILPSEGFATGPPAIVGYPIVTVPLGTLNATGAPFGLSFIGRKWSEPTLIALMAAFEANFPPRAVPSQLM